MNEEQYSSLTYKQTLAYHDELRDLLYEMVAKEYSYPGGALRATGYDAFMYLLVTADDSDGANE